MSVAMNELRDYVCAQDHLAYSRLPDGVVSITVSHSNLANQFIELKFDKAQLIGDIKARLHLHVGTSAGMMQLVLKSGGELVCRMDDDSKMLGYYGVESGMEIHVIDNDPFSLSKGGGLEDVNQVKKYRMSEEDYDKREGTLRSWIKEQKAKDPNWVEPWNKKEGGDPEEEQRRQQQQGPPPGPESVEGMAVGNRCEVQPGARRGQVMFLGEVEGMHPGYWVGVRFDEPVGKSNGTVKGKVIFNCPERMGGFIRPKNVEVGDYPEKDIMDELESDEEEM